MSGDPRADLAALLRRFRALLAGPQTGADPEDLQEVDALIRDVETGADQRPRDLASLFAPTSSYQDAAIGGGWGDEYCQIADQAETLLAALRKRRS